jgi:hypothetical protein
MAGTQKQPIKSKVFPRNVCLVPQKCKVAKNSYGRYPTKFVPRVAHTPEKSLTKIERPLTVVTQYTIDGGRRIFETDFIRLKVLIHPRKQYYRK